MKRLPACVLVAVALAASAGAGQGQPGSDSADKPPAATAEWTDHNQHDPGMAGAANAAPAARARERPSAREVRNAASKPRAPCTRNTDAAAMARSADRDSGRIAFGDGRHGRRPRGGRGDCADTMPAATPEQDPEQTDGNPDRPLVTGRVPDAEKRD